MTRKHNPSASLKECKTPAISPTLPVMEQRVQEERIYDDRGNSIVIRFTGDMREMYDFLFAYIEFRKKRRSKPRSG